MFARQSLVVLALVATGVSTHAQTVEVTMNVTATSRSVGHLVNGADVVSPDTGFQPQTFSYAVTFDLSNGVVTSPSTAGGQVGIAGYFDLSSLSSLSSSPYTASLMAMTPGEQATSLSWSSVGYALSVPETANATTPISVSELTVLNKSLIWSDGSGTTSYGRGVFLPTQGSPIAAQDLKAWSPDEFVAHLQAQTGKVFAGAYTEVYDYSSQPLFVIGGSDPSALSVHDRVAIQGDVVIASVTVVPEPSTYLLMGLGLPLIAAVRRHRQAA